MEENKIPQQNVSEEKKEDNKTTVSNENQAPSPKPSQKKDETASNQTPKPFPQNNQNSQAVKPIDNNAVQAKPSQDTHIKPKAPSKTKLFDKWDVIDIKITDLGLARYMSLDTKIVPHTFGKKTRKRFGKGELSIVERLINKVMRSGQGKRKLSGKYVRGRKSTGKKIQAMEIVERAFEIIARETNQNPIQIFIKSIENSAQREDITRMKKGGIAYTVAVDVAPIIRVDEALKNIALAAFSGSFNNRKKAWVCLAEEIILASKSDPKSSSIKRRDEVERIAKSSR